MGGVPPKSALGRSLGNLMQGARGASSSTSNPAENGSAPKEAELSRGIATLLRGANGAKSKPPAPREVHAGAPREGIALLRWSLAVADLLLCGLAAWLALNAPRPWGRTEILLCTVAVLAGAWLAYLALRLK